MAILNNSNAITTTGGYDVNNSLRLRASATAALNRTPGVAGNRKTWTWSGWVKRGSVSSEAYIFGTNTNTPISGFSFGSDAKLRYRNYNGSTEDVQLFTTQLFRDPSAWYHIIVVLDTTQATASNRLKFYVNGSQITNFTTATYPSLNSDQGINATVPHDIGSYSLIYANYDGYMSEVHFIDGSAKTPSDFGETDATTGVWKPKKYTGTYGTNGFYLKFSDIATTSGSNAGLGKDFSGNGNYFNTNNISVTSGTTYDAMTDSPTLTSATVANYAVMNPLDKNTSITASDGNLTINSASTNVGIRGTFGVSSGKWYYEGVIVAKGGNDQIFGAALSTWDLSYVGSANGIGYGGSGSIFGAGVSGVATFTTGDIIGVAFDVDALTIKFYKNNVLVGAGNYSLPSAGTYFPAASVQNGTLALNFGQRPFAYTPPTGFVALNTFNLPTPTILQGNKYMDATLWTGNGTVSGVSQTITNASAFKPDFVWVKSRSNAYQNALQDSVRGAGKTLFSALTNAEAGNSGDLITSFNSNGFTVNTTYLGGFNETTNNSGSTYVGWQWQAGQGSTSSNTSGSITSTVSVNATAGFSIVTYTGTGSAATIGHGLGVAPKMIVVKQRNGTKQWFVYHSSAITAGSTNKSYLELNTTNAVQTNSVATTFTSVSSTTFGVGTEGGVNTSTGTHVAYCWAAIPGYSAFGNYTGNGSADGPFVATNFKPKFIMVKPSSTIGEWTMWDSSRDTYNVGDKRLVANDSAAEYNNGNGLIDFLSNGFKPRVNHPSNNSSGVTYIYACFASNPFKNSTAV